MDHYADMKKDFLKGWNTWNTRSVLSHVLMPEGFALNLCLKDYASDRYMKEADVGDSGADKAVVFPGAHAYDGSYTSLSLTWNGIEITVESAVEDNEWVLLVTPLRITAIRPPLAVLEAGMLWNRPGYVKGENDRLEAVLPSCSVPIYATEKSVIEPYVEAQGPYLAIALEVSKAIGFSSGKKQSLSEITAMIARQKEKHALRKLKYGDKSELFDAMQSCLAWDTVYEPLKDRAVSTVSRRWNKSWGGYVLFCWDNYFAACMAALDSKEIAYSNVIEMTNEATEAGFVPNFAATSVSSRDRSQPPVGSMALREVYRTYREKWLIEKLFTPLFHWNTWFYEHRRIADGSYSGLFAWGSDPFTPRVGHSSETGAINQRLGAALESGLDNSPMYDHIPFNEHTHRLELADVGLTGLFIMDCRALAELAGIIGRNETRTLLINRAEATEKSLQLLWNEEDGFFYNRRTDTGEWNKHISPTNFYALYAETVSPAQAKRMMEEHFYNPAEFWGDYILPSAGRNDPAFPEQEYWRGRIWAPMNFLTYAALKTSKQNAAAKDLADKSETLILKEWREKRHVHENYNAVTGEGCDIGTSDAFYHWGGLLSYIALAEAGYTANPAEPL